MVERINGIRQLHQLGGLEQARRTQGGPSFADLLQKQVEQARPLKFSAHAQERMAGRGISLSGSDLQNLENAANAAAAKGSREALLMMNDVGFIVNVKSRMVLTALDTAMLNDRVVTNIDSAVFVQGTK